MPIPASGGNSLAPSSGARVSFGGSADSAPSSGARVSFGESADSAPERRRKTSEMSIPRRRRRRPPLRLPAALFLSPPPPAPDAYLSFSLVRARAQRNPASGGMEARRPGNAPGNQNRTACPVLRGTSLLRRYPVLCLPPALLVPLEPLGGSWGLLGLPEASQELQGPPGASCGLLGPPGTSCGLLLPPAASAALLVRTTRKICQKRYTEPQKTN